MPDINLTEALMEIREKVSAIQTELQHVSSRLEGKSNDLKELEKRVDALERAKGDSASVWFDYIVKGIMTLLLGYLAVRLGLK
jgi:chromosome segregation ATPase